MTDECSCNSLKRTGGEYCKTCVRNIVHDASPDIEVLEAEMRTIRMQKLRAELAEKEGI